MNPPDSYMKVLKMGIKTREEANKEVKLYEALNIGAHTSLEQVTQTYTIYECLPFFNTLKVNYGITMRRSEYQAIVTAQP